MAKALGIELDEGSSSAGRSALDAVARPDARQLDDSATARLLERLPVPAEPPATAESGFALREASLPRPRPGRIVDAPFPPPTAPDGAPQRPTDAAASASRALEVVRYQPEGEVDVARGVSITFSAPMVALDSVEAAVESDPPARLDPLPPGEWRWMDPRTLVFVPQGERMPMATAYRIEIPAGTSAANGASLAERVAFGFETPAPRVIGRSPRGDRVRPDSVVLLDFDQPVDVEAALALMSLRAGGQEVAFRAAAIEELAADAGAARLAVGMQRGRAIALRPMEPFPFDTTCSVTLQAGVSSLEGPKVTESVVTWDFATPGPFEVRGLEAGWGRRKPAPGASCTQP